MVSGVIKQGASMQRFYGVVIVLTTPLLLCAGEDDVQKELKLLQGKWKAVGLELGGIPVPRNTVPDFVYIVGADGKATGIATGKTGTVEHQARIIVDPRKNPKTIDNLHESGPTKGKKQLGIYKLEEGKWIVFMTPPGAAESDRPKSFDTMESKGVLFTFERVKEDKGK
jgi:uncharacterized protein (TIGR03067 family)